MGELDDVGNFGKRAVPTSLGAAWLNDLLDGIATDAADEHAIRIAAAQIPDLEPGEWIKITRNRMTGPMPQSNEPVRHGKFTVSLSKNVDELPEPGA